MSTAGSVWTNERVEKLKMLWAGGWSASKIAAELGDVSRNAVIGKVHRLGLSGRATAEPVRASGAISKKAAPLVASREKKAVAMPVTRGNLAMAVVASNAPELQPQAEVVKMAEVVPMARYLTLLQLDSTSCRWPIGDPRSADFRFCGAHVEPGKIYCGPCSRKAFQPKESRSGRR